MQCAPNLPLRSFSQIFLLVISGCSISYENSHRALQLSDFSLPLSVSLSLCEPRSSPSSRHTRAQSICTETSVITCEHESTCTCAVLTFGSEKIISMTSYLVEERAILVVSLEVKMTGSEIGLFPMARSEIQIHRHRSSHPQADLVAVAGHHCGKHQSMMVARTLRMMCHASQRACRYLMPNRDQSASSFDHCHGSIWQTNDQAGTGVVSHAHLNFGKVAESQYAFGGYSCSANANANAIANANAMHVVQIANQPRTGRGASTYRGKTRSTWKVFHRFPATGFEPFLGKRRRDFDLPPRTVLTLCDWVILV